MSAPWFYCPDLSSPLTQLSQAEAAHARGPLRLRDGSQVVCFDGRGRVADGVLQIAGQSKSDAVTVKIDEPRPVDFPWPVKLTLAFALPKQSRQDFLFEKCTELGVWAFQPLICERSVVRPRPERLGKWQRTTIEAAKQCHRVYLPELAKPATITEILTRADQFDALLLASLEEKGQTLVNHLNKSPSIRSVLAAIGPEGGLTADEQAALRAAGFVPVSLGPSVLRIETAATAVAAIIGAHHG